MESTREKNKTKATTAFIKSEDELFPVTFTPRLSEKNYCVFKTTNPNGYGGFLIYDLKVIISYKIWVVKRWALAGGSGQIFKRKKKRWGNESPTLIFLILKIHTLSTDPLRSDEFIICVGWRGSAVVPTIEWRRTTRICHGSLVLIRAARTPINHDNCNVRSRIST